MSDPTAELIPRDPSVASPRANQGAARWSDVEQRLRDGSGTTWLGVPTRSGVHTRPVFAAWTGSSLVFASNPDAAKTKHLKAADGSVSLAIDLGEVHLVVEGAASRLTSTEDLQRASAALLEVYDWPTEVLDGLLDAPYAAPTSGGPPFEAWEVTPAKAIAQPTADQFEPTRFTFA